VSETIGPHRLKSPLSRLETDAEGKPVTKQYQTGEVITPTEAELKAFGDRLEPVTDASAPAEEPPAEEPAPRSRR
jgi:hypothetical protein